MTAHLQLRRATASNHERVDRLFSRLDLSDDGDYRRFLAAQAAAHLPVEQAIEEAGAERLLPDWPTRRRASQLRQDLGACDVPLPEPVLTPALGSDAKLLGAVYVLEGSRLGGAILKRSVGVHMPRAFLGAPHAAGAWKKLLAELDVRLHEPAQVEEASDIARQVFDCFEVAGYLFIELSSVKL